MKNKIWIIMLLCVIMILINGCTRRQRYDAPKNNASPGIENSNRHRPSHNLSSHGRTVVKMSYESGIFKVPCEINGVEMSFIFDTGASDITMSLTEALFLYKQGKLMDDDFIGTQQYQIADGTVAEGMVVNLRTVVIGNRTLHDVQASIVHNLEAPLLLGQTALAQFGKISIDYNNNEIIFE